MPPSRQDYLNSLMFKESQGDPYKPSIDVALGMIRTAAVSFENLTNKAEWDRFLSFLQDKLNTAKSQRTQWLNTCAQAVGDNIAQAQMNYHFFNGQVVLLTDIMALPNQIIKTFEDLKDQIKPQPEPTVDPVVVDVPPSQPEVVTPPQEGVVNNQP